MVLRDILVGVIGGILIILALGVTVWVYGIQQYQQGYEAAQVELTQAANQALREARAKDHERMEVMQEEVRETKQELSRRQADAVAAHAASKRLRSELDRVRARHEATDTTPSNRDEARADTIGVLTELFSRADKRSGELAEIADGARVRGLGCEAAYDAQRGL